MIWDLIPFDFFFSPQYKRMLISKQEQMCGQFHAMVVNLNVLGERMRILCDALFLRSWPFFLLLLDTFFSFSVCSLFFYTNLEGKNLKMCIIQNQIGKWKMKNNIFEKFIISKFMVNLNFEIERNYIMYFQCQNWRQTYS